MKRRSEAAEQPSTGPCAGVGGGGGSLLSPACAAAAAALKWVRLPQPTAESSAESGACLSDAALSEAGPEALTSQLGGSTWLGLGIRLGLGLGLGLGLRLRLVRVGVRVRVRV